MTSPLTGGFATIKVNNWADEAEQEDAAPPQPAERRPAVPELSPEKPGGSVRTTPGPYAVVIGGIPSSWSAEHVGHLFSGLEVVDIYPHPDAPPNAPFKPYVVDMKEDRDLEWAVRQPPVYQGKAYPVRPYHDTRGPPGLLHHGGGSGRLGGPPVGLMPQQSDRYPYREPPFAGSGFRGGSSMYSHPSAPQPWEGAPGPAHHEPGGYGWGGSMRSAASHDQRGPPVPGMMRSASDLRGPPPGGRSDADTGRWTHHHQPAAAAAAAAAAGGGGLGSPTSPTSLHHPASTGQLHPARSSDSMHLPPPGAERQLSSGLDTSNSISAAGLAGPTLSAGEGAAAAAAAAGGEHAAQPAAPRQRANPFGAAKPVDTASKLRQLEEKAATQRKEAEEKARREAEEKKRAEQEAEAARLRAEQEALDEVKRKEEAARAAAVAHAQAQAQAAAAAAPAAMAMQRAVHEMAAANPQALCFGEIGPDYQPTAPPPPPPPAPHHPPQQQEQPPPPPSQPHELQHAPPPPPPPPPHRPRAEPSEAPTAAAVAEEANHHHAPASHGHGRGGRAPSRGGRNGRGGRGGRLSERHSVGVPAEHVPPPPPPPPPHGAPSQAHEHGKAIPRAASAGDVGSGQEPAPGPGLQQTLSGHSFRGGRGGRGRGGRGRGGRGGEHHPHSSNQQPHSADEQRSSSPNSHEPAAAYQQNGGAPAEGAGHHAPYVGGRRGGRGTGRGGRGRGRDAQPAAGGADAQQLPSAASTASLPEGAEHSAASTHHHAGERPERWGGRGGGRHVGGRGERGRGRGPRGERQEAHHHHAGEGAEGAAEHALRSHPSKPHKAGPEGGHEGHHKGEAGAPHETGAAGRHGPRADGPGPRRDRASRDGAAGGKAEFGNHRPAGGAAPAASAGKAAAAAPAPAPAPAAAAAAAAAAAPAESRAQALFRKMKSGDNKTPGTAKLMNTFALLAEAADD